MPSTAEDIIPPEYPAPSPQGYTPFTEASISSFLVKLDEVVVGTDVEGIVGRVRPGPLDGVLVAKVGRRG